jgi:hypothetical protein
VKQILQLDEWLGPGAGLPFGRAYAEVGENGWVSREIGLADGGKVVYKFPLPGTRSNYRGICDLVTFAADGVPDAISAAEFEALWDAPLDPLDQLRSEQAISGPSLRDRIKRRFGRSRK